MMEGQYTQDHDRPINYPYLELINSYNHFPHTANLQQTTSKTSRQKYGNALSIINESIITEKS